QYSRAYSGTTIVSKCNANSSAIDDLPVDSGPTMAIFITLPCSISGCNLQFEKETKTNYKNSINNSIFALRQSSRNFLPKTGQIPICILNKRSSRFVLLKLKMPRNSSFRSVLIIGSGPIIIGQACEFDYAGSQASLSLKEEGI